ncbi:MAG: hypothetical protein M3381_08995 [Actinomycetota bacterium]|nr:hypothetical protein [Actinomycetota bacterium]
MPDLRDLLEEAAGRPAGFPDISSIRRRARPRLVRRRLAVMIVCVSVALAGWGGVRTLSDYLVRGDGQAVAPVDLPPQPTARALLDGQLEPGIYDAELASYLFSIETRTDDWSVLVAQPGWIALTFRQYILHFQIWDSVVDPAATSAETQQPVPEDLLTWLAQHPRLTTSSPTEAGMRGVQGEQIDVRVVRPLEQAPAECSGQQCVILARALGGEQVDIEVAQLARIRILGPPGNQLVVFYRAPESEFAVLEQAAEQLLADIRFLATP